AAHLVRQGWDSEYQRATGIAMPWALLWTAVACHGYCARGLKCVRLSKAGKKPYTVAIGVHESFSGS
ncbi:MAG: hypothetical protein ACLFTT_03190, partial [Candidatus Hydrogenedentota bacterium]